MAGRHLFGAFAGARGPPPRPCRPGRTNPGGRCAASSAAAAGGGQSEAEAPPAQGPLRGVRVLDLGQVVAGNMCGALLGYFGAEVVKVEDVKGDALRSLRELDRTGTSLWWRSYGRNRKCAAIDLRTEAGRDLVKRLLLSGRFDVLVENFRPGVMEVSREGAGRARRVSD